MELQEELCKPDDEVDWDYICKMMESKLMGNKIEWLKKCTSWVAGPCTSWTPRRRSSRSWTQLRHTLLMRWKGSTSPMQKDSSFYSANASETYSVAGWLKWKDGLSCMPLCPSMILALGRREAFTLCTTSMSSMGSTCDLSSEDKYRASHFDECCSNL